MTGSTTNYRELSRPEIIVRDWDIVGQGQGDVTEYRIVFLYDKRKWPKNAGRGWMAVTTSIVNAQKLLERGLDAVTGLGPGSRVNVRSGKTYVLAGERWGDHDLCQCSVMDPTSWWLKKRRETLLAQSWWMPLLDFAMTPTEVGSLLGLFGCRPTREPPHPLYTPVWREESGLHWATLAKPLSGSVKLELGHDLDSFYRRPTLDVSMDHLITCSERLTAELQELNEEAKRKLVAQQKARLAAGESTSKSNSRSAQ